MQRLRYSNAPKVWRAAMLDRFLYFSTLGAAAYLAATFSPQQHVFLYVCGYIFAHTCFYRIAVAEPFDAHGAKQGLKLMAARPGRLLSDVVCILLIAQLSIYLTIQTADGDVQYALIIGYMLPLAIAYNKAREKLFPEGN